MKWTTSIIILMLSVLVTSTQVICAQKPNVWEVLRNQFTLDHEVTRPEVQNQLRWLIAHPSYLNELADAEPYIYHIENEIKKRHLPGELAIIPMIESSFDPFAYSGAGAAGLWQLMPGTGTDLGLKRDWWFDARRSIGPSTDAALNYLTYLHKFFHGNWILAVAAYDSGEGTMARIIKKSGQTGKQISFWSLHVPNETKAYIPRLLALAEIIQNPERYHVTLPDIPHTPYFEEVNIGSQIDLNNAAKLAGISYQDLIKLNQLKSNSVTRGQYVLIPNQKTASSAKKKIAASKPKAHQAPQAHQSTPTPSSNYKVIHIVQAYDSYPAIAKKYGVSVQQIRTWNHLKSNTLLHKGQALMIWKSIAKKAK